MRKLWTNEVGGVKMTPKKKKHDLQFEKTHFLHCSFLAAPLALHVQYDL